MLLLLVLLAVALFLQGECEEKSSVVFLHAICAEKSSSSFPQTASYLSREVVQKARARWMGGVCLSVGREVEGRFELKGCFSCQWFW